MAEDECCSTQLIGGDGEFNADGLESFTRSVRLAECGQSYAVVAIMGPQSSGKSTLLNHLFHTNFREMDANEGRSQTTMGIWIAKCVGIEPCTIAMDLEGSDGRERGEGFRKIVPGRWEFNHESFKKGEMELLRDIHRRKSTHALTLQAAPGGKANGIPSSPSNSGDDRRSGSTTSPDHTKNTASDETATTTTQNSNLSDENEKLRRDNELLNSELARTKKQCEDLVAFLSKQVHVAPEQINQIMMQVADGPIQDENHNHPENNDNENHSSLDDNDIDDDEKEDKDGGKICLKLFGVWLKGEKREGDTINVAAAPSPKKMKMARDYEAPWMKISSSPGETSKVCN